VIQENITEYLHVRKYNLLEACIFGRDFPGAA
jgi:hypothetical protein